MKKTIILLMILCKGETMTEIVMNKKDEIVMKILHYFVTEENYKPIILKGVQNEIWLENFDKDLKLIRININYIHNTEQYDNDLWKANIIRKNIGKKTLSLSTNMLNILIDTSEDLKPTDMKNIRSLKINKIGDIKKNKLLLNLFPSIKEKLTTKKSDINEFMKLTDELNQKTYNEEKKLDKIFKDKKPMVTEVLIGINIGIFVLMLISSMLGSNLSSVFTYYGSNSYELIQQEGVLGLYRLVTSMFIHADIFHIFFNMYALYVVGSQVERYYGKKKFLIIYFISGIFGSLFSNVFMLPNSMSIGASGAIFGLFGALGYFAYNYRAILGNFLKSSIIPVIVINLCLGLFISGVDVSCHIGGLIGGILISTILGVSGKEKKQNVSILIVFAILLCFMAFMIFSK